MINIHIDGLRGAVITWNAYTALKAFLWLTLQSLSQQSVLSFRHILRFIITSQIYVRRMSSTDAFTNFEWDV